MQQLVPGRARANQPHVQTHSAAPGGNVTFHDNRPLRCSNDGSGARCRCLPRPELGEARAGEIDVEFDRLLEIRLQVKAIQPGAERPTRAGTTRRRRRASAGCRSGSTGRSRPAAAKVVTSTASKSRPARSSIVSIRFAWRLAAAPAGSLAICRADSVPRANDRSESPRCEIRLTIPSKSASA